MREVGEMRFSQEHLWVRLEEDGRATVGITDYLQDRLGTIYNFQLPDEGDEMVQDEAFAIVDSQRGRRELLAPVSGEVVEVNYDLNDTPELANEEPYDDGWIVKLELTAEDEFDELLTEDEYEEYLRELEELGEEEEEEDYLEEEED